MFGRKARKAHIPATGAQSVQDKLNRVKKIMKQEEDKVPLAPQKPKQSMSHLEKFQARFLKNKPSEVITPPPEPVEMEQPSQMMDVSKTEQAMKPPTTAVKRKAMMEEHNLVKKRMIQKSELDLQMSSWTEYRSHSEMSFSQPQKRKILNFDEDDEENEDLQPAAKKRRQTVEQAEDDDTCIINQPRTTSDNLPELCSAICNLHL